MVEATSDKAIAKDDIIPPKKIVDEIFEGPYKFVNSERPFSYYYYDKLNLNWGGLDNYYCYHKLGRGKYSEVYEGANLKNNQKCVIKILKPVRIEK